MIAIIYVIKMYYSVSQPAGLLVLKRDSEEKDGDEYWHQDSRCLAGRFLTELHGELTILYLVIHRTKLSIEILPLMIADTFTCSWSDC